MPSDKTRKHASLNSLHSPAPRPPLKTGMVHWTVFGIDPGIKSTGTSDIPFKVPEIHRLGSGGTDSSAGSVGVVGAHSST